MQFLELVTGFLAVIQKRFIERYEKQEQRLLKLETKKHSFVNWRDVVNQLVLGTIVIIVNLLGEWINA